MGRSAVLHKLILNRLDRLLVGFGDAVDFVLDFGRCDLFKGWRFQPGTLRSFLAVLFVVRLAVKVSVLAGRNLSTDLVELLLRCSFQRILLREAAHLSLQSLELGILLALIESDARLSLDVNILWHYHRRFAAYT